MSSGEYTAAAAGLLALYLAVLFQLYGKGDENEDEGGTPFNTGLRFSRTPPRDWRTAGLIFATSASFFGGEAVALSHGPPSLVAAALVYFVALVSIRAWIFGLLVVFPEWVLRHQDATLNGAYLTPSIAALIAGLLAGLL